MKCSGLCAQKKRRLRQNNNSQSVCLKAAARELVVGLHANLVEAFSFLSADFFAARKHFVEARGLIAGKGFVAGVLVYTVMKIGDRCKTNIATVLLLHKSPNIFYTF